MTHSLPLSPLVAAVVGGMVAEMQRRSLDADPPSGKSRAIVSTQFLLTLGQLYAYIACPKGKNRKLAMAGVALCFSGCLLGASGVREYVRINQKTLSSFPEPRYGTKLVKTGVWRHTRHPMYSGAIQVSAGIGMVHQHPLALVFSAALSSLFVVKAVVEEPMLEKMYREEWGAYRKSTSMFLYPII